MNRILRHGILAKRLLSQQSAKPIRSQRLGSSVPIYATVSVCCSAFAYNWYANEQVEKKRDQRHRRFIDRNLVLSKQNYDAGRWWTMITCSVMHFHFYHLLVNMLPLATFGPIAVSVFGPASTAVIWLGSSLSCSYAAMIAEDHKIKQAGAGPWKDTLPHKDTIRHDTRVQHIGASGSVLGIISASACVFPKQKMYIFPLPLPVRLYAALGAFGIGSAYCWAQGLLPSIGHTGHLGGMAFGIAYYFLALKRRVRIPRT